MLGLTGIKRHSFCSYSGCEFGYAWYLPAHPKAENVPDRQVMIVLCEK